MRDSATMPVPRGVSPSPESDPSPDGLEPQGGLFQGWVVSAPRSSSWVGYRVSLGLHVVVVAALLLVPLFWRSDDPIPLDAIHALIYNPPPPPPPPLALGSQLSTNVSPKTSVETVQQPTPVPTTSQLTPLEVPQDVVPETAPERAGSLTGSATGDLEGMEGGLDGGTIGGVLGGVLGGVVGGTGDVPVFDYDQAPALIKKVAPAYPQDAFVKKIEGTVDVSILIDASGKVVRARLLRSGPSRSLDAAAIECVLQWVFRPAMKHGRPVATEARAPVRFSIF